ncbi:MAG TPA: helix-turn-helix domain-containing protein [Candidatus Mediterraneibacter faecipullorum]|uniref:Helix-turn-helix domain-containing protein n=1 Tax=Candidatus Mediterraneibacter faecipullorum TaxID=2838670 RepID=A0A9D2NJ77_9FIRM|nr:helix-turn-helix domain-containing protein [Candidatus Mediterraneibacter faecipullorum]
MGEVRFMISEAAKQVDVESHVLRYWEEELGLTIGRTEMGHRYYTKDDIQLFRCIKKLKDEGMLLRDLKPLIPELKATRLRLRTPEGESGDAGGAQNASSASAAVQAGPASADTSVSLQTAASMQTAAADPEDAEVVIPLEKLDQIRALFADVFREVLSENNTVLKKDISSTVTTDVMHEMDYLLQAKDRQQEEHFRKLDTLIRQQQANRKESAKANPIMKLRKIFT